MMGHAHGIEFAKIPLHVNGSKVVVNSFTFGGG